MRPAFRLATPIRTLSASPPLTTTFEYPPLKSPVVLDEDMALGVQDAVDLFIRHGIGRQRLLSLAAAKIPTVQKWQCMMECFLATQIHVLAGLGYSADEAGLSAFHTHLEQFAQTATPVAQELIRENGRDTWRLVLSTAFDLDIQDFEEKSIVDARNIMHKVAEKMQNEEILKIVQTRCASLPPVEDKQIDAAQRHHVVQQILVNDVYLGGDPSLVEECGFGKGEKGYALMQIVMAEHQNDPMVGQYIGTSMMRLMASAGIDVGSMQQAAS